MSDKPSAFRGGFTEDDAEGHGIRGAGAHEEAQAPEALEAHLTDAGDEVEGHLAKVKAADDPQDDDDTGGHAARVKV